MGSAPRRLGALRLLNLPAANEETAHPRPEARFLRLRGFLSRDRLNHRRRCRCWSWRGGGGGPQLELLDLIRERVNSGLGGGKKRRCGRDRRASSGAGQLRRVRDDSKRNGWGSGRCLHGHGNRNGGFGLSRLRSLGRRLRCGAATEEPTEKAAATGRLPLLTFRLDATTLGSLLAGELPRFALSHLAGSLLGVRRNLARNRLLLLPQALGLGLSPRLPLGFLAGVRHFRRHRHRRSRRGGRSRLGGCCGLRGCTEQSAEKPARARRLPLLTLRFNAPALSGLGFCLGFARCLLLRLGLTIRLFCGLAGGSSAFLRLLFVQPGVISSRAGALEFLGLLLFAGGIRFLEQSLALLQHAAALGNLRLRSQPGALFSSAACRILA